jgi:hypothetical protein
MSLDELLIQRPCHFSFDIMNWSGYFITKRGLKLLDESDIHNDVVASLLKLNFQLIKPTYDDFRRYVIAMTRSAVHRGFAQIHGNHCCGTCVFFQEGPKQCGCADLKPVPGQASIRINYSTKPKDVIHHSMVSLGQDDILNWVGFCARLSKEGRNTWPSSGKRIWELLSGDVRDDILQVAQTNHVMETVKLNLVEALNGVLRRQEFYQEKSFKHLTLATEAGEFLAQGLPSLSQIKIQRLNRLLLEASYPEDMVKSYRGCQHYSSKQLIYASNLSSLVVPDHREVEDTLEYMESLGPRQRKLAKLLRLRLEGYEISEIALQTGKHRTTIPKELYGTSEREKDELGEEILYHQAAAYEIFRAIYTGAIFTLEGEQKCLWSVVTRRDFSSNAVQPGFGKIGGELKISKRKTIEHYIEGWNWIKVQSTRGDGSVSRFEDNNIEQKSRQTRIGHQVSMNEMVHPDFHVLLTYAEGSLDRDARKHIAGHLLICDLCSAELEYLESAIIPEKERPINITERGRWLMRRISGRLAKASGIADREHKASIPAGLIAWLSRSRLPMSVAYGLALAVVGLLLILVLREATHNNSKDQINALTQQNEMLQAEIARQRAQEQAQQQRLASDLKAFEQRNEQLQRELDILKASSAQRSSYPAQVVTINDTQGEATIGRNVVINSGGSNSVKLPTDLSQDIRQFTKGNAKPTELADNALTTIRNATKEGPSRNGGSDTYLKALLLSPVLTAVRTPRPTLRWRPVFTAESYEVIVVHYPTGKQILKKPVGTKTELTIDDKTLLPGEIYLWEVVTKVSERDDVTVSHDGFWVLDEKSLRTVGTFEQRYKSSALVLASVYAKFGLYEDARLQLKQLKVRNPTSRVVERMLNKLPGTSR